MTTLKKIDFDKKKFDANGKTYLVEQSVSYDRWIMWRKVQTELLYGETADEIFKQIKKAYDLINQKNSQMIEAGIVLYNLMNGVKKVMDDERIPEVVQMCALFMNTKDEDRRTITSEQIREKANDWRKEGIEMQSFFLFAINSIPNFLPIYEAITQNTSQETVSQ